MSERWFSDEELSELSRPTMERAIEAIERGDGETAKALCEEMKHEWRLLHDIMVEGIAGLISYVQERIGENTADAVASKRRPQRADKNLVGGIVDDEAANQDVITSANRSAR